VTFKECDPKWVIGATIKHKIEHWHDPVSDSLGTLQTRRGSRLFTGRDEWNVERKLRPIFYAVREHAYKRRLPFLTAVLGRGMLPRLPLEVWSGIRDFERHVPL